MNLTDTRRATRTAPGLYDTGDTVTVHPESPTGTTAAPGTAWLTFPDHPARPGCWAPLTDLTTDPEHPHRHTLTPKEHPKIPPGGMRLWRGCFTRARTCDPSEC